MNRVGLGLAIGAGYVLGRTKKMKLALAVGSMVAGKKLNLTPRGVADLVSQQLKDNPQFKEIGEQLRGDLRGVGKAASGAMVERQMSALADRLHSRTGQVRDQLQGVVPDVDDKDDKDDTDDTDDTDDRDERDGRDGRGTDEEYDEPKSARHEDEDDEDRDDEDQDAADQDAADAGEERPRRTAPAKKAPAKKTAKKAPTKTVPAKKTAASARKTAERTSSRARRPKGGGER